MEPVEKIFENLNGEQKAYFTELAQLIGCPLMLVVNGRCEEKECQNYELLESPELQQALVICDRVKDLLTRERVVLPEELQHILSEAYRMQDKKEAQTEKPIPTPIIETKPRFRCVL